MPKVKGSNRLPKEKIIRTELATYEDMFDVFVKVIKKNKSELVPIDTSVESILDKAKAYHDWLAKVLSTEGAVSDKDVFSKLKELGL